MLLYEEVVLFPNKYGKWNVQRKGVIKMVIKKKLMVLSIIVFTVTVLLSLIPGVLWAFPEDMKVGQNVDEDHPEGAVTRVEFHTSDDGWQLIMPYRGDFGGDPYLNDGWVMNIYTHNEYKGHVFIYKFVHETDPRHTGDNPIWGSWDQTLNIEAGQHARGNSGRK